MAYRIVVNADLPGERISRHIYGHFAEHLGRCIYEGFWVGPESPIPNVRGLRKDVVAALKGIGIPNLRWPGGCFADEYHWRDGVGPRTSRPSIVNTHWGGVTENNHFGTHEFMDLCDQLGCAPYICGNVGSGTVQEMQQWVEYLTHPGPGPMADLRRDHGRRDPWRVPFWGVGNENWGCGGNMRAEYYADEYRRYQTYVRNLGDNPVSRIACGPNVDDYHWTDVLMREARRGDRFLMQGLSLHFYTSYRGERGSATAFDEQDWFAVLEKSLRMEELVHRHEAIMDRYDPQRRVSLIVDEWGTWYDVEPGTSPRFLYQQNSLRDALVAGLTLNIFNRHSGRVRMANIAQTVNVLQAMVLTDGSRMLLTPTYHVFDLYRPHHDAQLLPCAVTGEHYAFGGRSITAVHASASRSDDGAVCVTVVNTDPHRAAEASLDLRGADARAVEGRTLTAPRTTAHNTFDVPRAVAPSPLDAPVRRGPSFVVVLPPASVSALTAR